MLFRSAHNSRCNIRAATGAVELPAICKIVNPVQSLQQHLLALKKLITIARMQGIILSGIEVEKLGYILPAANIAEFKMIVRTV